MQPSDRLRIAVLGYIVRGPVGGMTWHHLQYIMGFAALGHDVFFIEDSGDYPGCYDPSKDVTDSDPAYGLDFAANAFAQVGLHDRWTYYDARTSEWLGPAASSALKICATADVLVNLVPFDPLRTWFQDIPVRASIDTDPAFTQVQLIQDPAARAIATQHNVFFSFGENIGIPGRSEVPQDGFPWQATRQPMVMSAWPVTPGPSGGKFTTVMQWDSYRKLEHDGKWYGMKSDSFGPYMNLPGHTKEALELAVGSATAPRDVLAAHGWHLRNPLEVTRDLWTYQGYIQQSKAEFTVAKHGYVVTRSGWFSERTAAYLASGRPAVVQQTGFSDWLPAGAGLIAFERPDEAIAGIEDVSRRYEFHCRAAREIAAEYFDFRKVLPHLLERAMNANRSRSPA